MRYLYDGYQSYRAQMGPITRAIFTVTAKRVRRADLAAAERVTHFIANSHYIAARIRRIYGRESVVIHPPIDLDKARIAQQIGQHYLCVGRLVGYKRTDLLIQACARLGRRLRIVGTGPEECRLRKIPQSVASFLGEVSKSTLWEEYANCRALLFCADEDFGMVSLEAQACGRPVIALGVGGSLETVRGNERPRTGVYFAEQTVESVMKGILEFEAADLRGEFDPLEIQSWAAKFATHLFIERMQNFILSAVSESR